MTANGKFLQRDGPQLKWCAENITQVFSWLNKTDITRQ